MMRLWDAAGCGPVTGPAGYFADVIAMLPDGSCPVSGRKQRLRLWDPTRPGDPAIELGPQREDLSLPPRATGGQLITAGTYANHAVLRLWDLSRPAAPVIELEVPKTCG